MKLLDRIYKEYSSMEPIDRKMQYWSMFNVIFVLVYLVLMCLAIACMFFIFSGIEYMPDGMHPVMWLINRKPLGTDYNSWWVQSEIVLRLFTDKQISFVEYLSQMKGVTDPFYVFELFFIFSLPLIVLVLVCLAIYKFFKHIVPAFLKFRWTLKDYDEPQKFEYDRYRLTLAIDYCCRGLDINQIKVAFIKGSDLQTEYFAKRKSEMEETAEDENVRRKEIYKLVYERLEYLVGKPQRKEKTFDNAVLFSTLAVSSFSLALSTSTFILNMNEDGWSIAFVVAVLLLCFVFARFIWGRLSKSVKSEQKHQTKSEKEFSEKIDYLMGLLEDVVFFNAPIIECDIDERVAYWKKRHEELDKQKTPIWENNTAEEHKRFMSSIKKGTIALLDAIAGEKKPEKNKGENNVSKLSNKSILITGAAGFIGANLVLELLKTVEPVNIIGIDSLNDYYDVSIKEYRLKLIEEEAEKHTASTWVFVKGSIADKGQVESIFKQYNPSIVVNLAAQAGVRYSITNPDVYIESNLIGFYNILEACRHSYDNGNTGVEHLVYASSSSVYGSNKKVPYSTDDKVDNPVSLYAATKKSNELLAHAYSKLYNIPSTGLRFFTVYGPAGRPDMAYFGFTDKLRAGKTIQIFNYGNCKRDFTYVDDIVRGVMLVMQKAPEKKTGEDGLPVPPYALYNIGNNSPENLLDFVDILQQELIRARVLDADYDFESHKELVPMQPGDVPVTYADTSALERDFGFKPSTDLRTGLRHFAEWYKEFYMNGEDK